MENSQNSNASIPSDMPCALKTFDEEANTIVDGWLSELKRCPVPEHIYHYTADIGLRGILESGKLWLTDVFSLNDPSEVQHGVSIAMDLFDKQTNGKNDECQELARDFRGGLQGKSLKKIAHFFVCSFSACKDDLGQWRAYADNGRGYALGFDTTSIKDQFRRPLPENRDAFPVTYDDCDLTEIHRRIIEKVCPHALLPCYEKLSQRAINTYRAELLGKLATHVVHASLYFKHKAYSNEQEYRFLEVHSADTQPDVQYRSRPYSLIKYREFDWKCAGPRVLKKIIIGPAALHENHKKTRKFAEDCLDKCGIKDVDIVDSDIPYRRT